MRHLALSLAGYDAPSGLSGFLDMSTPSAVSAATAAAIRPLYFDIAQSPPLRQRTPPESIAASCAAAGRRPPAKRACPEPRHAASGGALEEWSLGPGVPFISESLRRRRHGWPRRQEPPMRE